jgi:hypothetical protein
MAVITLPVIHCAPEDRGLALQFSADFSLDLEVYATGGVVIDLADIDPLIDLLQHIVIYARAGKTFDFDPATNKVLAYDAAGAEVANGVDLSGLIETGRIVYRR